ncbi:transposase, partial [Parabacteroides distasonis]|nr:transposase [Parabacteroides distasonis]
YAVEDMIKAEEKSMGRKMTSEEKVQFRNENAKPLWTNLKLWCEKEILHLPHESKIFDAMNYLIRHYDELIAYLDIADMPLDNTDTERSIRDMVMGKQAYLYCRNYEAVDRACIMYSMFGACKVLGKNPERWLTYVLKHIDTTPKEDLHKLLPEEWEDA